MRPSAESLVARLRTTLLRTWLAFSIAAFAVAVVCSVLGHDNPLKSDDPYCVGAVAAVCCAGFSLLLGVTGAFGLSPMRQRCLYSGVVLGLTVLCIAMDAAVPSPEAQGILTFFGILIGLSGAAYPLFRVRLTRSFIAYASVPGLLYFLGLAYAAIVMNAQRF